MLEPRVLVVEDDPSWQENLKETVEDLNYAVQVAGNFREADLALDRQHFHLVLVDLRLRSGTKEPEGMKLLQKVAELAEGTRTIVISGYADATLATAALKEFDAYYVLEKEKVDPRRFIELAIGAVVQATEQYHSKFPSAIDFLRGNKDVHPWAAEVLTAILGTDRISGLRDLDQLRDLLNELLAGLHPLLYHRRDKGVIIDRDVGAVSSRCWSKALGEPILVRFGGRESIEGEVAAVDKSSALLAQKGFVRRERAASVSGLGGVVYVMAEPPFEDFVRVL